MSEPRPTPAPLEATECEFCGEPLPTPVSIDAAFVENQRALSAELKRRGQLAIALGLNVGNSWDQIMERVAALAPPPPAALPVAHVELPLCAHCLGAGNILTFYDRPGGPPGNGYATCQRCGGTGRHAAAPLAPALQKE